MSFGTTEGDVDGSEIDYEPFIPKDPTAGEPRRSTAGAHRAGAHRAAAHHPDGGVRPVRAVPAAHASAAVARAQGTQHEARRSPRWRRRRRGSALIVGGVAVTRNDGSSSAGVHPRRHATAPSASSGSGSGGGSGSSGSSGSSSSPSTIPGLQGVAPVMDIRAVLRKVEPSVVAIETNLVSQNGGVFGRGARQRRHHQP